MDTRVKPAYDAAYVAASCENFRIQISNSHGSSFPRRRASWAFSFLPSTLRGDGPPKGAPEVNGRSMFPALGKQRHTATPLSVPPRRLKTLVRSSGDLADLRKGP